MTYLLVELFSSTPAKAKLFFAFQSLFPRGISRLQLLQTLMHNVPLIHSRGSEISRKKNTSEEK